MPIPESLQQKIELFKAQGYVERYTRGMFLEPSWVAVYLGQGVIPQQYHPCVDRLSSAQITQAMGELKSHIAQAVSAMPSHQDSLSALVRRSGINRAGMARRLYEFIWGFFMSAVNPRTIRQVVILGGGITGWVVAAGLAHGLKGLNITVTLVDCAENTEPYPACESTTPTFIDFHRQLGIHEVALVKAIQASYKLATHYNNWSSMGDYYLPFSEHGFMINSVEFQHYFIQQAVCPDSFDSYSLASMAAKQGRFRHPSEKQSSLFSTISYAVNFPCNPYLEFIKDYALHQGVVLEEGRYSSASVDFNASSISGINIKTKMAKKILKVIFSLIVLAKKDI